MKFINIRAHDPSLNFQPGINTSLKQAEEFLFRHMYNSAPKNIGRDLVRSELASSFEEWRFWRFPTKEYVVHGLPLKMIHCVDPHEISEVKRAIDGQGAPDVIWAEGLDLPVALRHVLNICANSIKLIYPKYCEPWLIKGLSQYDACLVDESWQIEEMEQRHPDATCVLWDKLVDYEEDFLPIDSFKKYDVCYVARLDPRKYHKLLFLALRKLRDRKLRVVLVGNDENDCQKYLVPMAQDAGVEAVFTGDVSCSEVNRYINESRLGVLCDKYDAVPRAMLEYMAANVPVLATAEMRTGLRYIGPKAGLVRRPERFHLGIAEILDNPERFQPRQHLIENFSRRQVTSKFWRIIRELVDRRQNEHGGQQTFAH